MSDTRDNSGALFRERDRKSDRAPEYTGKAMIGGKEYRVAAWIKEGRSGQKFFSLAFEEPRQHQEQPRQQQSRPISRPESRPAPDLADDIPFQMEWR